MNLLPKMPIVTGVILLLGACSSHHRYTISLENDASCNPLYVKDQQELIISLPSNPSTGYQWSLVSQPQFLTVIEENNTIHAPNPKGLLGVPETAVWHYKVNGQGKAALKFIYHRIWEKDQEPANQFNCEIISE